MNVLRKKSNLFLDLYTKELDRLKSSGILTVVAKRILPPKSSAYHISGLVTRPQLIYRLKAITIRSDNGSP